MNEKQIQPSDQSSNHVGVSGSGSPPGSPLPEPQLRRLFARNALEIGDAVAIPIGVHIGDDAAFVCAFGRRHDNGFSLVNDRPAEFSGITNQEILRRTLPEESLR